MDNPRDRRRRRARHVAKGFVFSVNALFDSMANPTGWGTANRLWGGKRGERTLGRDIADIARPYQVNRTTVYDRIDETIYNPLSTTIIPTEPLVRYPAMLFNNASRFVVTTGAYLYDSVRRLWYRTVYYFAKGLDDNPTLAFPFTMYATARNRISRNAVYDQVFYEAIPSLTLLPRRRRRR